MRTFTLSMIAMLSLFLLACGHTAASSQTSTPGGGGGPVTLTLGNGKFDGATTFSMKVGQTLTITDPMATGGLHIIVMGQDALPMPQDGAPADLNVTSGGVMFNPGDSKNYTFSKPGTFMITCTLHSIMNATITVTA